MKTTAKAIIRRILILIGVLKRVVELMGLPEDWTSAPSFTVVIPLRMVDIRLAERGLQQALKLRDAVADVCHELCWDDVFQTIHAKRQANMLLSDEEQKYVTQADINYLEMVIEKMDIAVFYDGDFYNLPASDRLALYRLIERYPGCSLVSSTQALGWRRKMMIDPKAEITSHEAKKRVRRIFRSA